LKHDIYVLINLETLKIIGLDNKQSPSTKAAEIIFSMGLEN
jgi:hypothetical protein